MRSLRIAPNYLFAPRRRTACRRLCIHLPDVRCARVSASYTAIIQGEIAQAQQVRVLQVNFKKQVQAWKDILLRGKDDAALSKYETEFHSLGAQVQTSCASLSNRINDQQARVGLENFQQQHQLLGAHYDAALANYRKARDFAQADAAVKGKDRAPTDSLDQVVDRLSSLAESVPAAEAARLQHEQTILIAVLVCCGWRWASGAWFSPARWASGWATAFTLSA